MADIHVMAGDGERWSVIMHFTVPDTDNVAGVNYRTALVNSGLGGSTAMVEGDGPGQIATTEKEQIQTGVLCEHSFGFWVEGNGADAAVIRALLRKSYAREKALKIASLQSQLKYFGHTETQA